MRRIKEREKEKEVDGRDRQREKEELDEIRRKLEEEGHPDLEAEIAKVSIISTFTDLFPGTSLFVTTAYMLFYRTSPKLSPLVFWLQSKTIQFNGQYFCCSLLNVYLHNWPRNNSYPHNYPTTVYVGHSTFVIRLI